MRFRRLFKRQMALLFSRQAPVERRDDYTITNPEGPQSMRALAPRLAGLAPLLAFACLASGTADAQSFGYASGYDVATGSDSLYRIDLQTGAATRVGPFGTLGAPGAPGLLDVEGLAFHPDGTLYGATDGSPTQGGASDLLIRVSTTNGSASIVAPLQGLAGLGPGAGGQLDYGLASTCDGRLWMASDTLGHLWEVNRQDGSLRRVITGGPQLSGLASRDGVLYGISTESSEALYRIDTQTFEVTRVGGLGLANRIYDAGLDFDSSGRLWATLDYMVAPDGQPQVFRNDIAELDPETGAVIRRVPITGAGTGTNTVQMEGLAIAPPPCSGVGQPGAAATQTVPVDSPWALLLMGFAFGGVAAQRLRRS